MSDLIRHECGIAVVRLKKPLEYYHDKYGTALYGFNKLFLLMEKQHNRGHDGMGIGAVKLGMSPGQPYMFRFRSAERDSLTTVFNKQVKALSKLARQLEIDPEAPSTLRDHFEFGGQVLMGHLRYGTSGRFGEGSCHPYVRRSSWETRSLMVMGNFNMANSHELNQKLINRGQHPVFGTDTQTVLEEIGYHLDEAHGEILRAKRGREQSPDDAEIAAELDIVEVLEKAASIWDGGYTIAGAMGSGDVFVMRDARGIRPGYYFENEEVVGFASERVPLLTVFDLEIDQVQEIQPGEVVIVNAKGELRRDRFAGKEKFSPCSFERIYFSRGNDPAIYEERKRLGALLVPRIMEVIEGDLDNTIFSFIPNTAEIAYHGMMEELRKRRRDEVKKEIVDAMA
ncbi:MAG: amidophosphoribosyltransferase, partial [Verrucomicrobiota bacterium]